MKHIRATSKIRRPEKAAIPLVDDIVCAIFPKKEKCAS